MKLGWALAWLAGLAVAAFASRTIWLRVEIADPDLHIAAALAPVILWALVPFALLSKASRPAQQPDGSRLREQYRAVVGFLSDQGLRGHKGRHSLPLYLVAGPPGSGKTSVLEQAEAGLGPPLTVGGSTWWVGRDAIFVEAAFGMPGDGAHEVFALLRSVRPQLPLNGVVLVVSPADLALADQTEQRLVAQAIAGELRSLEETIKTAAPVYLLLSKIDLVPGFREFFERHEPEDRVHPWGFGLRFPGQGAALTAGDRAREIDTGFQQILSGMRVRHIEWLSREADPVRCGRIQSFAAQVAALRSAIGPILGALFPEQTHAWGGACLRGVFLTSARQEPLAIDVLLPDLSRRFAMPRIGTLPPDLGIEEEQHGYFVAGTLKSAILPEAGLVARVRPSALGNGAQWLAFVLIAAVMLSSAYAVVAGFQKDVSLAGRLEERAADAASPGHIADTAQSISALRDIGRRLRALDALEAEIAAAPDATILFLPGTPSAPVFTSSRNTYATALGDARRRLRGNVLLPHLSALMEAQLVDLESDDETLRGRVLAALSADDPNAPALRSWLSFNVALIDEHGAGLVDESLEALRENGGLTIDPAYLDAAQRIIAYRESLS